MTTRGLLYRMLTIVLSLALVFAAGELLLRLNRAGHRFVNTAVGPVGRGLPRNLPDFRDRPQPGPKVAGSFRILALGDSFVWGAGVRAGDTYPRRLERRLGTLRSELDFEVVNWSRSGWNTKQAWEAVRPRLQWLAPDLVLLGFTLNDPEPTNRGLRERMTEPLHRRTPQASWSEILHRHSALYRLFWERLENRRQRRAFVSYYDGLFTGPHWDECRQALRELRQAVKVRDIPLVLVVMPVFDSQLDHHYSYRRLHRKVAAAARELEIPVLDLLATYRRVDARRLAVTPFSDPHPNELAHRIAADELTNYLVDERLVPATFTEGQPRTLAVRRR